MPEGKSIMANMHGSVVSLYGCAPVGEGWGRPPQPWENPYIPPYIPPPADNPVREPTSDFFIEVSCCQGSMVQRLACSQCKARRHCGFS